MTNDKKTIGITKTNLPPLVALMEAGCFASELDAAKFAMAYAVKHSLSMGKTDGAETKWNIGSVDPEGTLRLLIESLFPECAEPYRMVEHLMNQGISNLHVNMKDGGQFYDTLFEGPSAR